MRLDDANYGNDMEVNFAVTRKKNKIFTITEIYYQRIQVLRCKRDIFVCDLLFYSESW